MKFYTIEIAIINRRSGEMEGGGEVFGSLNVAFEVHLYLIKSRFFRNEGSSTKNSRRMRRKMHVFWTIFKVDENIRRSDIVIW